MLQILQSYTMQLLGQAKESGGFIADSYAFLIDAVNGRKGTKHYA
jgi:hypothetical protein